MDDKKLTINKSSKTKICQLNWEKTELFADHFRLARISFYQSCCDHVDMFIVIKIDPQTCLLRSQEYKIDKEFKFSQVTINKIDYFSLCD